MLTPSCSCYFSILLAGDDLWGSFHRNWWLFTVSTFGGGQTSRSHSETLVLASQTSILSVIESQVLQCVTHKYAHTHMHTRLQHHSHAHPFSPLVALLSPTLSIPDPGGYRYITEKL